MLAQLKTVALIKEATKLASIRPVECLQPQHARVSLQCQNGPEKKELSSETRQPDLVLRHEGYSITETAKKLKISYNLVKLSFLFIWQRIQ